MDYAINFLYYSYIVIISIILTLQAVKLKYKEYGELLSL